MEMFFEQLMELARKLNEEKKRTITENLTEEELAVFDILTKPRMELSDKEIGQVKKTARNLLETLRQEKLVLDWRKRQKSRAAVRVSIEKILDGGLPEAYGTELFNQKAGMIFQHIFEAYQGAGQSIFQ